MAGEREGPGKHPDAKEAFALLAEACRRAWERGLLAGRNGNFSLSARGGDGGEGILITRSGAYKGRLTERDAVFLRPDGSRAGPETGFAEGRPSSEAGAHLALYRARPEIGAVAHTHPPLLSALFLPDDASFPRLPLHEAGKARERFAFVPSMPPGTEELARAVALAGERADAVWMRGHGLICVGADIFGALALAEELEHLAAIQLSCARFGA
jgi:L-fuculose-phosphate aldolase